MRRVLSVLLENQPGALSRVANLFSARGYNIVSLTVAPTQDTTLSRMTIVTYGDDATTEQITKQVNKLIEVLKVVDITEEKNIERELMIIKLRAEGENREEIKRLTEIFRGTIINVTQKTYIIQLTGYRRKLDSYVAALGKIPIVEIARSGVCGMTREDK